MPHTRSQMEETMNEKILNVILTTIIATLATITFAGIIRSILGALAPYEEKQPRRHDKQARRHLADIPNADKDKRLPISELAAEHQKIAQEWRKTMSKVQIEHLMVGGEWRAPES